MPGKKGPGGKGRKKGKGAASQKDKTLLVAAAVDERSAEYAFVREVCGQGHYRVVCNDGRERLGVLRGSMRRRVWVRRNDVILVTKRDFQDDKADIVHKYGGDEVLRLISMGEMTPALVRMYNSLEGGGGVDGAGEAPEDDDDCGVVFDEDADYVLKI